MRESVKVALVGLLLAFIGIGVLIFGHFPNVIGSGLAIVGILTFGISSLVG